MKRFFLTFLCALAMLGAMACSSEAPATSQPTGKAISTDILVIGAGGTGLSAAYHAKTAGKSVILIEKRAFTGGNTGMAGFIEAGGSKAHKAMGVSFSADDHFKFLMQTPGVKAEYARILADMAGPCVDWLTEDLGLPIGKIVDREIYAPDGGPKLPGLIVVKLTSADKDLGVDLRLETTATALLFESGKVVGAKVESPDGPYQIRAKAVILASGGFAASDELIKEFSPAWAGRSTSNTAATTGDGIRMARAIGAKLTDMDAFTLNPTFYDNKGTTLSISGVRYAGGILVGRDGKRFSNEMADYSVVSEAEMKLPEQSAYAVMDQAALGTSPAFCVKADTIEALADMIGVDKANLVTTVENYRSYFDAGKDAEFGRTDMRSRLDKAPFYAVKVFPGVHHTRGGVTINTRGQVLDTSDKPIPGLYAGGEVADAFLFGNDPVSTSIVFGKLAALSAAADIK